MQIMSNKNFMLKPVDILLVEDNPGDVLLTEEAFLQAKIKSNIHVAEDGEIALKMLRQEGEYNAAILPDIILLDLNLPKKDGREVLQEIKADDFLKKIPVVILTSSQAEQDITKSYNLHANSYIIKPVNLERFGEIVQAIENFWFSIVALPNN